ncbi:MAG TPA: M28 family peptidase, partial [Nonomuraea sp.]|nr:M28 family peptidase [Nonomuraea sp.]
MADMAESKSGRGTGGWGLLVGLVLFGLTLLLVQARQQPTAARGADAPATEFSAARSIAVLRTLVGDGSAHPVGSPADDLVRERILAELRRLGYSPEVQEGTWCGRGMCARVRNVVARLDGGSGKAVLLMAHYDSVPAGPGVSDDLSGV